jgi:fatty acid desaturase
MIVAEEFPVDANPAPGRPEDVRFRRGYTAPPRTRTEIAAAHTTRLWFSVGLALADEAIVVAAIVVCAWPPLWRGWGIAAGLVAAGVAAVVTGRQYRAVECLAHEASHFNWSRRHRRVNDLLAMLLASAPTGARLDVYRASHLDHHGRFGTQDDPDLANYRQLRLEELDRSGALAFAAGAFARMARYRDRWSQTSGGRGTPRHMPLLWAAAFVVLPAGLLWWRVPSALIAAGIWILGFYVMLPIVRFIGESSEHVYTGQDTVFDATVSNLGLLQRILIHPHGDGYHTVHHLWPGVPHHQIRRLHRLLVVADPEGYASRLRCRTRVLSSPGRGIRPRRLCLTDSIPWLNGQIPSRPCSTFNGPGHRIDRSPLRGSW